MVQKNDLEICSVEKKMGLNVSVEWAEISACFEDRSMVQIRTNLSDQMKTKLYKHDNEHLYFTALLKKYIVPIDTIKCVPSPLESPDDLEKTLKVKLFLGESFLNDQADSIVLHYVYECDLCLSCYDYHINKRGVKVHIASCTENSLCLNSVSYNHPNKRGAQELSLQISFRSIYLNLYRVFKINHHIHGELYLLYDQKGLYYITGHRQTEKIAQCEPLKKIYRESEIINYRENVNRSVHHQEDGGCLYLAK